MAKKAKDYLLVRFDTNWADEMDVQGFAIMTKEEWSKSKKMISGIKSEINIGYGSNEDEEFEDGKSFLETFDTKKITESEVKTITKFFGKYNYGTFPLGQALDQLAEELERLEDED